MLINSGCCLVQQLLFKLSQSHIITILFISIFFFLVLLILGIRKSYKLKKENDKLNKIEGFDMDEANKTYKDFRDGHLYE
ncbi:hypothetical protein EJA19_11070 [Mangrovimonas spongiae]|uniref:Uncharacterized protein n=1 Tax=Mangrovimonas spongiae TaxID=2494697 RepID=A0A3R9NVK0_9FLAO|nr:hypothetical protein EJA19_11070 [Mangrovimonas spongiae]